MRLALVQTTASPFPPPVGLSPALGDGRLHHLIADVHLEVTNAPTRFSSVIDVTRLFRIPVGCACRFPAGGQEGLALLVGHSA